MSFAKYQILRVYVAIVYGLSMAPVGILVFELMARRNTDGLSLVLVYGLVLLVPLATVLYLYWLSFRLLNALDPKGLVVAGLIVTLIESIYLLLKSNDASWPAQYEWVIWPALLTIITANSVIFGLAHRSELYRKR